MVGHVSLAHEVKGKIVGASWDTTSDSALVWRIEL